jgi:YgiT-type zinc finger domain-containing protein
VIVILIRAASGIDAGSYPLPGTDDMSKTPVCPETGKPLVRDTRPMTISFRGRSSTFDMPGWYCDESGESIHIAEDIGVSDAALKALKIRAHPILTPRSRRPKTFD